MPNAWNGPLIAKQTPKKDDGPLIGVIGQLVARRPQLSLGVYRLGEAMVSVILQRQGFSTYAKERRESQRTHWPKQGL